MNDGGLNMNENGENVAPVDCATSNNATSSDLDSWKRVSTLDLSKMKVMPVELSSEMGNENVGDTKREVEVTMSGKSSAKGANSERTPEEKFERIRRRLEVSLGKDVFASWFARLKINSIDGGVAIHSVPTPFLKNWILTKYRETLLELWQEEDKSILRVDVGIRKPIVQPELAKSNRANSASQKSASGEAKPQTFAPARGFPIRSSAAGTEQKSGFSGSPLDKRHTFETFVEGTSNRMVHAAARTIADDITASSFNPLILHASVGLGKTHLLQAIAWRARARNPKARVLYLTAEYFMWRLASAIRDNTALTLKESLRDIDLLLIDDLQFLQGKSIQAEFCHLLNELIDSARQVVVAADRAPPELESLDERVRSRLRGGVTLEIKTPDYELRKEILNRRYRDAKVEQPNLDIPEDIPADIEIKTDESSLRSINFYPYKPLPNNKESYAIVLKVFNPTKKGLYQFHSYGQYKGTSVSSYLGSWTTVID